MAGTLLILYLDTSALIKLWIPEPESATVKLRVQAATGIATAAVAYAETRAALAAMARNRRFGRAGLEAARKSLDEQWPDIAAIAINDGIIRAAGDLAETHGLRGFDAVHLACYAQLLRRSPGEPVSFFSFDLRLQRASERLRI